MSVSSILSNFKPNDKLIENTYLKFCDDFKDAGYEFWHLMAVHETAEQVGVDEDRVITLLRRLGYSE